MPLIARQRSRLAVLAVLALVGSLLAVSAVPVAAEADEKVSAPATYSACIAAATTDAGFTDLDAGDTADAANCLAHYGITKGRSEGIYAPKDAISRQQMALFMTRAAGPAGIEMDDTEDQGFTDIANFNDSVQNAINQAAALDIMAGTSDTTFDPSGTVSRADMAVILDGFLMAAEVDLDEVAGLGKNEDLDVDTPFNDVGSVSFAAYAAINRMYEFGVATGTGDGTTFAPSVPVTRGQMAKFVTRALAHTNARPAGLSIQANPMDVTDSDATDLQVSLRDSDHMPVPDELIEVFGTMSAEDAFDDEGDCVAKNIIGEGSQGAQLCEIDAADEATGPEGNVEVSVNTAGFCPGSMDFYAWSGDIGDTYDSDETESAWTSLGVTKGATQLIITSDMPEDATQLEFGDSITITFQVANADDDPVGVKDLAVTVSTSEADTTNELDADDQTLRQVVRTLVNTYKTNADGRVDITFSQDDPDSKKDVFNQVSLDFDVTAIRDADDKMSTLTVDDKTGLTHASEYSTADARDGDDPDPEVEWSDSAAKATTLSISQAVKYHEASDDASGVRNTVQATLLDQYGDPVSNVKVRFWSNADNRTAGAAENGLGRS